MAISAELRARFERAGLELIRMDYVSGSHRVIRTENRAQALEWINEQEGLNRTQDKRRYGLMLALTALAALGAVIAAIPVVATWISN
jgi:hypothetical protein